MTLMWQRSRVWVALYEKLLISYQAVSHVLRIYSAADTDVIRAFRRGTERPATVTHVQGEALMLHNMQQFLHTRQVSLRTLAAVLMGFLLVGLAVASDVYRPGTTAAAPSPAPSMGASTRPDSFA